jgi:surface antigen
MIEILLFGLAELKPNPLIQNVNETQTVQVEPPLQEPTLEEKIASDYYKCEPLRYIRADTAECGDIRADFKVVVSESSTKASPTTKHLITAPANWFKSNQCTGYVASKRPVGRWNNASEWYWQAQRDGWSTGEIPQSGAIGVARSGNHVVYVEQVDGNRIYLSERNYDYNGSYRERWANANEFRYIY